LVLVRRKRFAQDQNADRLQPSSSLAKYPELAAAGWSMAMVAMVPAASKEEMQPARPRVRQAGWAQQYPAPTEFLRPAERW
jgi:hypothetical protein